MGNSTEALKLAIQLRDTASGYWTENEIPIIDKLIELLAQPEQKPATYSAWGLMGGDEFVNKDSLNRNIT